MFQVAVCLCQQSNVPQANIAGTFQMLQILKRRKLKIDLEVVTVR